MESKRDVLKFRGARNFRQRIVMATLSGRAVQIDDIRAMHDNPGVRDYEASFLRLIDKISNGCAIKINETGTQLKYRPGVLIGGSDLTHDCPTRSIGYFLEGLICLAPFAKTPLSITLRGISNHDLDTSVDIMRTVTLPLLKHFGIEENMELKIKKRGAPPKGGGEVTFRCPIVKELKPINLTEAGKLKRIRGVCFTAKISPQVANRIVDKARGVLNHYIPDVYIYSDHYKGKDSGLSAGFGISLVAQSNNGMLISSERTANEGELPEDIGKQVADMLCEEISRGGCVDSSHQSLMLQFMVLCPEDVSRIRLGQLTPHTIDVLRLLKEFFGVTFKIKPDPESSTVLLSCLGVGFKNFARPSI